MTFLPIIERELRVRARSRGTYWMRFARGAGGNLDLLAPVDSLGALRLRPAMEPARFLERLWSAPPSCCVAGPAC